MEPDTEIYQELTQKILRLEQNSFELGGCLAEMARKKHYLALNHTGEPKYNTFEEFCAGELRKTKSAAYTLIRAHECYEILREYGCERLPISPYTVRTLSRLENEEDIVRAWERACSEKNSDKLPSKDDVERAVRQLLPAEPTRGGRRATDKYISALAKVDRELAGLMQDLDFRQLLRSKDSASQDRKRDIATKITTTIRGLVLHHAMITGHLPRGTKIVKKKKILTPKSITVSMTGRRDVRYRF